MVWQHEHWVSTKKPKSKILLKKKVDGTGRRAHLVAAGFFGIFPLSPSGIPWWWWRFLAEKPDARFQSRYKQLTIAPRVPHQSRCSSIGIWDGGGCCGNYGGGSRHYSRRVRSLVGSCPARNTYSSSCLCAGCCCCCCCWSKSVCGQLLVFFFFLFNRLIKYADESGAIQP